MNFVKEIMKLCLSLRFSLSVIFAPAVRRKDIALPNNRLHSNSPMLVPPSSASVPEVPAVSSFSGTVIRDGSRFALREPDGTLFALDSTGRAWPFEGEDVLISGYFNLESRLLHICAIEGVEELKAQAV